MNRFIICTIVLCTMLFIGCNDKKAENNTAKNEKTTTKTAKKSTTAAKVPEGTKAMKLSDGSEVIWLKDNPAQKFNPRELFPDANDELWNSLNMPDGLPATISTFLLKVGGEYILFDAGLGDVGGQMVRRLTELNIYTDDIKLVYLTHFHGDHIGGMITTGENGEVRKTFPNAAVYASKAEYDAWMNVIANNDLQKNIMEMYHEQLHLFDFGETLPHNVLALDAVGHTPGHTAFRYENLLIVGALMHGYALQKDHPEINSIYDMDKEKSIESRKRIMDYAKENNLIIAGMHLPEPGFVE